MILHIFNLKERGDKIKSCVCIVNRKSCEMGNYLYVNLD